MQLELMEFHEIVQHNVHAHSDALHEGHQKDKRVAFEIAVGDLCLG
jgi:hypothetical protein